MKHLLKIIFLSLFFSITLLGCLKHQDNSSISEIDQKFLNSVAIADMNRSLQLSVDNKTKIFRYNSEISLTFQNMSQSFIQSSSPPKLFTIKNGEWAEVKNKFTYSGAPIISPKGTILLDQRSIPIKPVIDKSILDSSKQEIPLRILIICQIMENNIATDKLVGAYTDVVLSP